MIDIGDQEDAMREEAKSILPPGTDFQIGYAGNKGICFVANCILSDDEEAAVRRLFDKYRLPKDLELPGRRFPTETGIAFDGPCYRGNAPYPQPEVGIILGGSNPFSDYKGG